MYKYNNILLLQCDTIKVNTCKINTCISLPIANAAIIKEVGEGLRKLKEV